MKTSGGQISMVQPEFAGIRVTMAACMIFFFVMTVFKAVLADWLSGLFYLAALLTMGIFFFQVVRTERYSRGVWFLESVFFLIWMAGLRVSGGGTQPGVDAGAVVVMAFAIVMGSGILRLVVILLSLALPIFLRVLETRWSTELYVARPFAVTRLVTGATVLSMAVVLGLLMDRVVAAYFRQRELAQARLETLSRMLITDGMTGLANQTSLFKRLSDEVSRAGRNGTRLSVLMLDIDDFKTVNDAHGHLAGDAVIVAVAGVLASIVRPPEFAGRRGGDEFVMVLPDSGIDQARDVAARVVEGVSMVCGRKGSGSTEREVRHQTGDSDASFACRPVTVSIGVVAWDGGDAAQLMSQVDARLRRAKELGKDRIVSSD